MASSVSITTVLAIIGCSLCYLAMGVVALGVPIYICISIGAGIGVAGMSIKQRLKKRRATARLSTTNPTTVTATTADGSGAVDIMKEEETVFDQSQPPLQTKSGQGGSSDKHLQPNPEEDGGYLPSYEELRAAECAMTSPPLPS